MWQQNRNTSSQWVLSSFIREVIWLDQYITTVMLILFKYLQTQHYIWLSNPCIVRALQAISMSFGVILIRSTSICTLSTQYSSVAWYWPGPPVGRWTAGLPHPSCAAPSPCPSPSGNWTVTAPLPLSASWYWPRFSPVSPVFLSPFFHHQNPNINKHKFIFSIPEALVQKYRNITLNWEQQNKIFALLKQTLNYP